MRLFPLRLRAPLRLVELRFFGLLKIFRRPLKAQSEAARGQAAAEIRGDSPASKISEGLST
jgi:hypothetical protein